MNPEKILVVDDHLSELRAAISALRKAGFEVMTARDGMEGVDVATKEHPDLILLDYDMPVMNGFDVMKELQQRKIPTRVIFISVHLNREDDPQQVIRSGASHFLKKPLNNKELVDRVRWALETQETLAERVVGRDPQVDGLKAEVEHLADQNRKLKEQLKQADSTIAYLEAAQQQAETRLKKRISTHNWILRVAALLVAAIITVVIPHVSSIREVGFWGLIALFLMLAIPLELVTKVELDWVKMTFSGAGQQREVGRTAALIDAGQKDLGT